MRKRGRRSSPRPADTRRRASPRRARADACDEAERRGYVLRSACTSDASRRAPVPARRSQIHVAARAAEPSPGRRWLPGAVAWPFRQFGVFPARERGADPGASGRFDSAVFARVIGGRLRERECVAGSAAARVAQSAPGPPGSARQKSAGSPDGTADLPAQAADLPHRSRSAAPAEPSAAVGRPPGGGAPPRAGGACRRARPGRSRGAPARPGAPPGRA